MSDFELVEDNTEGSRLFVECLKMGGATNVKLYESIMEMTIDGKVVVMIAAHYNTRTSGLEIRIDDDA